MGDLIIINDKILSYIIKIIRYDNEICGGLSDCFESIDEENKFILYITLTMTIPNYYIFEIWDLIGLHGCDILNKTEREEIEYLYVQGFDNLVDRAKKSLQEWSDHAANR